MYYTRGGKDENEIWGRYNSTPQTPSMYSKFRIIKSPYFIGNLKCF